jgi:hypothetical protein
MNIMNGKYVIFMEKDFIALLQPVQSGFVQRVVHDTLEELPATQLHLDPEVFTPAS